MSSSNRARESNRADDRNVPGLHYSDKLGRDSTASSDRGRSGRGKRRLAA